MYNLLLTTLCLLAGCNAINGPIVFEDEHPPVYIEETSTLNKADYRQLGATLNNRGLLLSDQHNFDGYKLVIHSLEHHSHDLYENPSQHLLYGTVNSYLDVSLIDRQTEEILWRREYKTQKYFNPNAHFYSDQAWANAELLWQQQQKLFQLLSDDVYSTCRKTSQASGT